MICEEIWIHVYMNNQFFIEFFMELDECVLQDQQVTYRVKVYSFTWWWPYYMPPFSSPLKAGSFCRHCLWSVMLLWTVQPQHASKRWNSPPPPQCAQCCSCKGVHRRIPLQTGQLKGNKPHKGIVSHKRNGPVRWLLKQGTIQINTNRHFVQYVWPVAGAVL